MKNTRKRVRKKQIWQFSGTNDSRGKRRTNSQNYENMKQLKIMQKNMKQTKTMKINMRNMKSKTTTIS